MNTHPIISAILRHSWAIDPAYALNAGPIISGLLSGYGLQEMKNNSKASGISMTSSNPNVLKYYNWDTAPEGSIAHIMIKGELMKADMPCGPIGMASIGKRVQEADQDPRFIGILLQIDSPGGTVDGTEVLSNIVKNTKKPVLTYVDGLMASAAAWIGTSADEIWASTDTDEIGSIGVLMSFWDIIPAFERQGYKFHLLTATTSPDKTKLFEDIRKGNYKEYQEEILDVIDKKFMNTIKQHRPNVKEEHLTGKMFFAKNVMGILVDQIGTFEEAVSRLVDLSQNSIPELNNNKTMGKLNRINEVLGVDSLEVVEGYSTLNEEQLDLIEAALATGPENHASSQDEETSQTIADLRDANRALREENESLKSAAAGGSASAITKGDGTGEDKDEKGASPVTSESDDFETSLNKISNELKS